VQPSYQAREDRVGAPAQLGRLADAQERGDDYQGLAGTLERMLELGGDQGDNLMRLYRARRQLGLDGAAIQAAIQGLDAALQGGDVAAADERCGQALQGYPMVMELHERQALIGNRAGDAERAALHYRRAATLAEASGRDEDYHRLLHQAVALNPNDLALRLAAARQALQDDDVARRDKVLGDFVRFATRGHNLGLALHWAQERVRLAEPPAFVQRGELIDLLGRLDRHEEELAQGRELLAELWQADQQGEALELLQRLAAGNRRHADLVWQLAQLHEERGESSEAVRHYRQAVTLLQQEERGEDALKVLERLRVLAPEDPEVQRAFELLDLGQAVSWSAIRHERVLASKRRIEDETDRLGSSHRVRRTGQHAG